MEKFCEESINTKMLNQIVASSTNEANSSGLFLKNYLEYIEEFPGKAHNVLYEVGN